MSPEQRFPEGGAGVGLLSLLMIEVVPGKPQSGHCPFTQDLPYRCTCCKCLSPFSFAGLLSDPLLLPDCSFSFSSAVAYANVSCQRLKHKEKSGWAVAAEGLGCPPLLGVLRYWLQPSLDPLPGSSSRASVLAPGRHVDQPPMASGGLHIH